MNNFLIDYSSPLKMLDENLLLIFTKKAIMTTSQENIMPNLINIRILKRRKRWDTKSLIINIIWWLFLSWLALNFEDNFLMILLFLSIFFWAFIFLFITAKTVVVQSNLALIILLLSLIIRSIFIFSYLEYPRLLAFITMKFS